MSFSLFLVFVWLCFCYIIDYYIYKALKGFEKEGKSGDTAWAGYGIYQKSKPPAPPIKDLDEHTKTLMSMKSQKERRKHLEQMAKQNIKDNEGE